MAANPAARSARPHSGRARRRVSSSVSSHTGQWRRARPSPGGNGELWTERQARRSGGTEERPERGHCEGRHCWAGGRHPRASPFYGFLIREGPCLLRPRTRLGQKAAVLLARGTRGQSWKERGESYTAERHGGGAPVSARKSCPNL